MSRVLCETWGLSLAAVDPPIPTGLLSPQNRLKLTPIPLSATLFVEILPTFCHFLLTCSQILVITIRSIRTGLGVCQFGRSLTSRGRIPRERSTPLQAQGAAGRHYQGGQAPLLLPEARREKAC